MRLKNKVALITGGGSGIGQATAILFAAEGASVMVSDLNVAGSQETLQHIKAAGGEAVSVAGDVTDGAEARHIVRSAVQAYGRLNVLVNCAGVSSRNAVAADASPEDVWDRVIAVNLKGTYLVSWHAVPELEKAGGGSIVNLASIMSLVGYSAPLGNGFDPYPPSKGGVLQFTRNLAIDCARKDIRVNCVCPGYVATPLTKGLTDDPETLAIVEARHPMGRLGRPEEIAYAALYLASDESAYVTGAPLVVDGGYTAQ